MSRYSVLNTVYKILPILAFALPLALYVKTLAPTYIPIDSAEFALCMHFWGICHPPGFPLYVFLGKLFTDFWPWGTLIYKANLFSAIFGAGTILLVYLTLVELKVSRSLAFLAVLFLAVSQVAWEFSIAADVFSFGTFLIALALYLTFKNKPLPAFFALGLSASHFYITAVLWPLLAWYFLGNTTHKSYRTYWSYASYLLVFALGFFPQALMFWRMQQSPEISWGHARGISGFIEYARRKEFGSIFLISNPVLTFSIFKVFKQFWAYFAGFFVNFAVVLPIATLVGLLWGGMLREKRVVLLILSFIMLVFVQLVLLSTIDPLEKGSPFQLNKFYLSSFVIWAILTGLALDFLAKKFFEGDTLYLNLLMGFLILIFLLANLPVNNYSKNYFSENMILDAYSQLPSDAVAITVSHIAYFGGLYEQKVNGKFKGVDILYFPNEKNRDSEKYHPEVFNRGASVDFVKKISKDKSLGKAEGYILETIAKNMDRPVFILQGSFEERFFGYLVPFIAPYGLWWQVQAQAYAEAEQARLAASLSGLRNEGVVSGDLELKQQKDDLLTYAVSYHSAGIYFASRGDYDGAVSYLKRSFDVNPEVGGNIGKEIELIEETKKLELRFAEFAANRDKANLEKLAGNVNLLGNFEVCTRVYAQLVVIDSQKAENFNNLAACQASLGRVGDARANYQKALEINPDLELAKKGLETLEE